MRDDEAIVTGRRRRFAPTESDDHVTVRAVGRDGTVLLFRSSYGNYPTVRQSIVHGRVETSVLAFGRPALLDEYHDAQDYAGSFYAAGDEPGATPPRTEPIAFVRENGRTRLVGRGVVVAWNPGNAVATKVEIESSGDPAFWEEEKETHCRIQDGGRTYDLGRVRYVGRESGGAFVFSDAETSAPGVYLWRGRRLVPWARLPSGWTALATDGVGGLLARRGDSWDLAILRGQSLHPIWFIGTSKRTDLAWNAVASLAPNGRFRITAYQGTAANPYDLTFKPNQ